ncbi:MAG: sulfotransferase [Acidimicrobiia bacterium]
MAEDTTSAVDRMLEEVSAEVGLDDFGHPSFRDGLERVYASGTRQAGLTPLGLGVLDGQCRGNLTNRLRVTDWHKQHPELATDAIHEPIVIVGLSRTGTTALSQLLACDTENRSLLGWEASQSVPPPTKDSYDSDPRFEAARAGAGMLDLLNPGFKAMHYDPPDQPIECSVLLAQHFLSASLSTCFNVPDYDAWMLAADAHPAYAYHRQVLQVLQLQYPGGWQLKTPVHCFYMDALADTYPDARFVVTHRDPVKAVASVLSLVESLTGTFSDVDHHEYIAEHWPMLVEEMCNRVLDFRDANPNSVFHDMPYEQLVRDPVGAVRDMYGTFGRELSPEAEQTMRAHSAEQPQGVHGTHTYRLADFGLDRAEVAERFSRYYERFDVAREDA